MLFPLILLGHPCSHIKSRERADSRLSLPFMHPVQLPEGLPEGMGDFFLNLLFISFLLHQSPRSIFKLYSILMKLLVWGMVLILHPGHMTSDCFKQTALPSLTHLGSSSPGLLLGRTFSCPENGVGPAGTHSPRPKSTCFSPVPLSHPLEAPSNTSHQVC